MTAKQFDRLIREQHAKLQELAERHVREQRELVDQLTLERCLFRPRK
jgi:hypothetical protein